MELRTMARSYWNTEATRVLTATLKRKGIGHDELARRLEKHGIKETRASIANKLCRGAFSAAFLMQCLDAIDSDVLYVK
jgi:hypothetical protein